MSNPENDSRLEQRSREAAEGFSVPVSPSWEIMERELDKVLPVERKRRRPVFFWWIIPGLIVGVLVALTLIDLSSTKKNKIPIAREQETRYKEETRGQGSAILNLKSADTQTIPISSTPINSFTKDPYKKEVAVLMNFQKSLQPERSLTREQSLMIEKSTTFAVTTNENVIVLQQPITENKANNSTVTVANDSIKVDNVVIRSTTDTGNITIESGIIEQKDSMTTTLTNQPEVKEQDSVRQQNKARKSDFSFALVAGLDATTVKFRYADKANVSGGVMMGYHFNNNWSVHTGALFTRKNYKMAGNDFKAPAGSWVANYKLETVDGFCNMWEIPLLMRYIFDSKTKTNVFISTGLSSYLMTRENYNYFYYYNGLPVRRNANYPNGKTHLLAILKISGGWIKQTGKTASFAVEPFANLPLSGLGFGSVQLSSFGLNFSYQFRQPTKKK